MIVKVYEVDSGLGNIKNGVCLAENYRDRAESYLDTPYLIELPEGYSVEKANGGTTEVYCNGKHVKLTNVNYSENHITGVSIGGFHRFKIVNRTWEG